MIPIHLEKGNSNESEDASAYDKCWSTSGFYEWCISCYAFNLVALTCAKIVAVVTHNTHFFIINIYDETFFNSRGSLDAFKVLLIIPSVAIPASFWTATLTVVYAAFSAAKSFFIWCWIWTDCAFTVLSPKAALNGGCHTPTVSIQVESELAIIARSLFCINQAIFNIL